MIGVLRHRLLALRPVSKLEDDGDRVVTWHVETRLWVHVKALRFEETARQHHLRSLVSYEVTARAPCAIVPGWRLVWRGRSLRVQAARDPDGWGRAVVFLCEQEETA